MAVHGADGSTVRRFATLAAGSLARDFAGALALYFSPLRAFGRLVRSAAAKVDLGGARVSMPNAAPTDAVPADAARNSAAGDVRPNPRQLPLSDAQKARRLRSHGSRLGEESAVKGNAGDFDVEDIQNGPSASPRQQWVLYEGFGPGAVGILVEALTADPGRTAFKLQHCFAANGGVLLETGAVSCMFDRLGEIVFTGSAGDAEAILGVAIGAGADDVVSSDDRHVILCAEEDLAAIAAAMEADLGKAVSVRTIWRPSAGVEVNEAAESNLRKLMALLEGDEDVRYVYTNLSSQEAALTRVTAA